MQIQYTKNLNPARFGYNIELARYVYLLDRGGSRGRVQGVHTLP